MVSCIWSGLGVVGFLEQFRLAVDEQARTHFLGGSFLIGLTLGGRDDCCWIWPSVTGGRYDAWLCMANFLYLKWPLLFTPFFAWRSYVTLVWTLLASSYRLNVELGSTQPADFVCLFDSGIWFSIPELLVIVLWLFFSMLQTYSCVSRKPQNKFFSLSLNSMYQMLSKLIDYQDLTSHLILAKVVQLLVCVLMVKISQQFYKIWFMTYNTINKKTDPPQKKT